MLPSTSLIFFLSFCAHCFVLTRGEEYEQVCIITQVLQDGNRHHCRDLKPAKKFDTGDPSLSSVVLGIKRSNWVSTLPVAMNYISL